MRGYIFIPSLLLCAVLFYMPTSGITEGDQAYSATIPESQNQLIKLTDDGVEPSVLKMRREDSIAFFLNDSTDSLVTLNIDFGKHATHCSSSNMKIGEDGVIRSTQPVGPKDFASTCFHDSGTYDFTVYGLKKSPKGLKGSIVVE